MLTVVVGSVTERTMKHTVAYVLVSVFFHAGDVHGRALHGCCANDSCGVSGGP